MDVSVTARLTYAEFRPPADLALWLEAIAILEVPPSTPRRQWYAVPDARGRLALPLSSEPGALLPPAFARNVRPAPTPNTYAMVRFGPWATGPLRLMESVPESWSRGLGLDPARGATDALEVYSSVAARLRKTLAGRRPDTRVVTAWRTLSRAPQAAVDAVAETSEISSRTLLRSMQEASCCTVRTARTLQRLRGALRLLRSDLSLPWSWAAVRAGFYDQAHFARTFQRRVGMAPTRFFEEGHHHFNDVFARAVRPSGSPPRVAVGEPVLRTPGERHRLARDGRRRR